MDKHFFMTDFNPGIAWSMLREAAVKCKLLFLWSQNSREWSYGRMEEIGNSLRSGEHRHVETATVARGTTIDKESKHAVEDFTKLYKSSSTHMLNFADAIDKEARSALKAQVGAHAMLRPTLLEALLLLRSFCRAVRRCWCFW